MTKTWKLAALAALVALGLLVLLPGARPTSVSADVDSIEAEADYGFNGDDIEVTIAGEMGNGNLEVDTSSGETFDLVSCDDGGDCTSHTTDADPFVLDTDNVSADYELVLTMELSCSDIETITVTAEEQSGDADSATVSVVCIPDDARRVIIAKDSDDNNQEYNVDWTVTNGSGNCAVIFDGTVDVDDSGTFDISEDLGDALFYCEDNANDLTVTEDEDADFVEINDDGDCDDGDSWIDITGAEVAIDLDEMDGESEGPAECTFVNREGGSATNTPAATNTPSAPTGITVALTPSTIGCQSSAFVTVTVANASDGTDVMITASLGSISPGTADTFGGSVLAVYTAPAQQGGAVTITATAGGLTGTAALTVNCGQPTAVPTTVATAATGGAITPPDTGDAGLATSGAAWSTYLGLGLIALAVGLGSAGVLGVVRSRTR